MMIVVITAKRVSDMVSGFDLEPGLGLERRGLEREGESDVSVRRWGRHLRTASTEARQG